MQLQCINEFTKTKCNYKKSMKFKNKILVTNIDLTDMDFDC